MHWWINNDKARESWRRMVINFWRCSIYASFFLFLLEHFALAKENHSFLHVQYLMTAGKSFKTLDGPIIYLISSQNEFYKHGYDWFSFWSVLNNDVLIVNFSCIKLKKKLW
jgi:hypothetical protein